MFLGVEYHTPYGMLKAPQGSGFSFCDGIGLGCTALALVHFQFGATNELKDVFFSYSFCSAVSRHGER